jgi:hypothetical protein
MRVASPAARATPKSSSHASAVAFGELVARMLSMDASFPRSFRTTVMMGAVPSRRQHRLDCPARATDGDFTAPARRAMVAA